MGARSQQLVDDDRLALTDRSLKDFEGSAASPTGIDGLEVCRQE